MNWGMVKDMIKPELLVLVPVLYFIGAALKKSKSFMNNYIPLTLGLCGMFLSLMYLTAVTRLRNWQDVLMLVFVGITQGILSAGTSVYINQLYKQMTTIKHT